MTLAAEFLFGRWPTSRWAALLANYDLTAGRLWRSFRVGGDRATPLPPDAAALQRQVVSSE